MEERETLRVGVAALSRLMVGDEVCYFKPWYEMRNREEVQELSKDLADWKMRHTELVTKVLDGLTDGDVFREEYLQLEDPPLVGKIDILQRVSGETHLYEVKTGRKSHSHYVQLLLYMFIASRDNRFADNRALGHLVYEDNSLDATENDVPPDFEDRIRGHIAALLSEESPRKVRSPVCNFCMAECEYSVPRYGSKARG